MSHTRSSIALLCNSLGNALLQFVIVLLIARMAGASETGRYALAQSYMMPAMFLGMFSLRAQALMDRGGQYDGNDYLSVRTLYGGLIFFLALIVTAWAEPVGLLLIATSIAAMKMMDGYSDIAVGILQRTNQRRSIMLLSASRLAIGISSFYIAYRASNNLAIALGMLALTLALHFLLCDYRFCRRTHIFTTPFFTRNKDIQTIRHQLIRFGLPIGAGVLLGTLQVSAVRIILDRTISAEAVGHFSVMLQLIMVGQLIIQSIGSALMPSLQHAYQNNQRRAFLRHLGGLALFVIICVGLGSIASWLIGDWFITTLFGHSFSGLASLLLAGCIAALPFYLNTIIAQTFVVSAMPRTILWINALGLVVLLAIAKHCIAHYGAHGAFYAIAIATGVQLVVSVLTLSLRASHKQRVVI